GCRVAVSCLCEEAEDEDGEADDEHTQAVEPEVPADVVRAQVSGGSAEEVDDQPDRGGRTETGNPEACDQPGRSEELHDREHPPPVAGESDAVEAGGNGPRRPEGQQSITEDDDGEDDDGPDGIGERSEEHTSELQSRFELVC